MHDHDIVYHPGNTGAFVDGVQVPDVPLDRLSWVNFVEAPKFTQGAPGIAYNTEDLPGVTYWGPGLASNVMARHSFDCATPAYVLLSQQVLQVQYNYLTGQFMTQPLTVGMGGG